MFSDRIKTLLRWAETGSPRARELHRYITQIHQAILADSDRMKQLIELSIQCERHRSQMAEVARKFLQSQTGVSTLEDVANEDWKLYTGAIINNRVVPFLGKPPDDTTIWDLRAAVIAALRESFQAGCPRDLIREMFQRCKATMTVNGKKVWEGTSDEPF